MQLSVRQRDRVHLDRRSSRRGLLSAWSIYALLVAGLCTALVINHLWLSALRLDARRCAEASALAAGHGLLSDSLLRRGQTEIEQQWRIEVARLAGIRMSERYQRACGVPGLSHDDLRYTSSAMSGGTSGTQQSSWGLSRFTAVAALPDRVTVAYGGLGPNGQPKHQIALFLPGVTGIRDASLGMHATVRILNCPVGFRPSTTTPVPMVPFAIPDKADATDPQSWTWLIEQAHGRDDYSWSEESHRVTRGPDGIPEISLMLSADAAEVLCGQLIPISFSGTAAGSARFSDWIMSGFSTFDWAHLPGMQLNYPQPCDACEFDQRHLDATVDALVTIMGRAVIVSTTEVTAHSAGDDDPADESDNTGPAQELRSLVLNRPAAVRVVDVRQVSRSQVEVTLQPCVMTTVTAIMDPAITASSPYIYQVQLAN